MTSSIFARRRRLAAAACFALAVIVHSTATAAAPATTDAGLQLSAKWYCLPNGLKVALSHDPDAPRTTVCVAYHVGSKNEREGLTGFAHFFEHMMFRGTQHVPNFDIPLQQAGGSPNAFTSEDMTVYFQTVPNNYVERVLYMEADRMAFLSSALDQDKFDTEREVVKNERRQSMENAPYGLADETLSATVYPKGHPYSWSVIGSMDDLNRSTLEDLRRFFYEFYHPGNATLTLVGGFDSGNAKQLIQRYFGPLKKGPERAQLSVPPVPTMARRLIQKDRVQFPRVYWAWPTVKETDPDAASLDLLSSMLTNGDASRLRQSLVIRQQVALSVSASSSVSEVGGTFTIDAIAAADKNIGEIEALLTEQIGKIQATPPTEEELRRVKVKQRTSQLIGLASPMRRALVIAMGLAQYRDPQHYEKMFERMESVTCEDIQRVAKTYLSQDKTVLVIEPVSPGEPESPAVLAGPLAGESRKLQLGERSPEGGPDWTQMPAPAERKEFVPPAYQKVSLSNGLEVWICPWRTLPIVTVRLLVQTGSADDPESKAGLAALTAELWDKGTKELTATQLSEKLDALGTTLNVAASRDTMQLSFNLEKRSLPDTLPLIGTLIASPRFEDGDFQREKNLQLSALAAGPDSPAWVANRVFPRLLFGAGHPYSSPRLGYVEDVRSFELEDVRKFYRDHVAPQSSTLIVVGDIQANELIGHLEEHWASWRGNAALHARPMVRSSALGATVHVVDKPGAVQSVISVGRVWRNRKDEAYLASKLGNRILGGDFLSRINQNLREQHGYTYGARSAFQFYRTGSEWKVTTSVRTDVTGAALREILHELEAVCGDRPLTESEIETARDAELNIFPQAFETPSSIAAVLAPLALFDLPKNYLATYGSQLASADRSAIVGAMRHLVDPAHRTILVVGDRRRIVEHLKEAGFADVRFVDSDGNPVDK